jgi:hypothetical protein
MLFRRTKRSLVIHRYQCSDPRFRSATNPPIPHCTQPNAKRFHQQLNSGQPGMDRTGTRVRSVADRRQSLCQLCQWTPERSMCSIHDALAAILIRSQAADGYCLALLLCRPHVSNRQHGCVDFSRKKLGYFAHSKLRYLTYAGVRTFALVSDSRLIWPGFACVAERRALHGE